MADYNTKFTYDDDDVPFGIGAAAPAAVKPEESITLAAVPAPIEEAVKAEVEEAADGEKEFPAEESSPDQKELWNEKQNDDQPAIAGYSAHGRQIIRTATGEVIYDREIADLGLTVRPYNSLTRNRIMYVSQIVEMTRADLKAVRKLGSKSFDEIIYKTRIFLDSSASGVLWIEAPETKEDEQLIITYEGATLEEAPAADGEKEFPAEESSPDPKELWNEKLNDYQPAITGYSAHGKQIIRTATGEVIYDREIADLGLTVRSYNSLRRNRIMYVSQIVGMTRADLKAVRKLGSKTFDEIIYKTRIFLDSSDSGVLRIEAPEMKEDEQLIITYEGAALEDLGLSRRSFNALKRAGIDNLMQLAAMSDEELQNVNNLGRKSIDEIKAMLKNTADDGNKKYKRVKAEQAAFRNLADEFYNNTKSIVPSTIGAAIKDYLYSAANASECSADDREAVFRAFTRENYFFGFLKEHINKLLDENRMTGLTIRELDELLPELIDHGTVDDLLSEQIESGDLFESTSGRYLRKYPKFREAAGTFLKDRELDIFSYRLAGMTLDDIGKIEEIGRERIRQIISKIERKLTRGKTRTFFHEERFLQLYTGYHLTDEEYTGITGDSVYSYKFLNMLYDRGARDVSDILTDENIPLLIKERCARYLREQDHKTNLYPEGDEGEAVPKNRTAIEDYLLKKYCRDEKTIDEFMTLYTDFVSGQPLTDDEKEKLLSGDGKARENRFMDGRTNILWKRGRKLRYYDVPAGDYTELLETLDLGQFKDIGYSTLKFFRLYPELMKRYDIRDEYELHNLLRKIGAEEMYPDLKLGTNPTLKFGNYDRDLMIKQALFELAPISANDLTAYISEEYGFREGFVSNWYDCIREYYKDGMFSVDYEPMSDEQMQTLKASLTDDFYYISEIRETFLKLYPDADPDLISSFNLKRMGFLVYTNYVLQHYNNATAYFEYLLTKDEVFDITPYSKRYGYIMAFTSVLDNMRHRYEIIEYEPYQYINIRRLRKLGIEIEDLNDYCLEVKRFVEGRRLFTISQIKAEGFSSKLDELGFDNWFYSSVLRKDKESFSYNKMGGTVLFSTDPEETVTRLTIIEYVVSENESIGFDELMAVFTGEYGIQLDTADVKTVINSSTMYYDKIFDTVYINRSKYYEELDEIDDELFIDEQEEEYESL